MDTLIRALGLLVAGAALLALNIWFLRAVWQEYGDSSADEVVILPFGFASGEDEKGLRGGALARLFASRLASIQGDFARVHQAAGKTDGSASAGDAAGPSPAAARIDVTLLILPQPVDVPASLFEPLNLSLSVGGVEVGGLLAQAQRFWVSRRTVAFTIVPKGADRVIVTADLSPLLGPRHRWFSVESDARPDEIAANLAYAVVQRRMAEDRLATITELDPPDFRRLVEIVIEINLLNERVRANVSPERRLVALLPELERLAAILPNWHELTYLTASVADSVGNRQVALTHYRVLERARDSLPAPLRSAAAEGLARLGSVAADRLPAFVAEMRAFAQRMDLQGPDPEVALIEDEKPTPGLQALWNEKKHRFEINPANIADKGMPQYVALMGRFMARHFARCFGANQNSREFEFWNDLRASVVGYLITSQPEFAEFKLFSRDQSLARLLRHMASSNADAVKRLALELLERYDCDWTKAGLRAEIEKIDRERGLLLGGAIQAAFDAVPEWRDAGKPAAPPRRRPVEGGASPQ